MPGWINVDNVSAEGVDIVHDLTSLPLPFPDASVEEVLCSHVLEHLLHWEPLVQDIYRVLMPGGKLTVRVPYGIRGMEQGYHLRFFFPSTLDIFTSPPGWDDPKKGDGFSRSLEYRGRYEMVHVRVNRYFMHRYHLKKYLHIKCRNVDKDLRYWYDRVLGKRDELIYVLRRPEART
jgi:SAM-dependent methyltransferase